MSARGEDRVSLMVALPCDRNPLNDARQSVRGRELTVCLELGSHLCIAPAEQPSRDGGRGQAVVVAEEQQARAPVQHIGEGQCHALLHGQPQLASYRRGSRRERLEPARILVAEQ